MSLKNVTTILTTLILAGALAVSAYAHCGGCGAGEKTKEHKHDDSHAACVKKCDSATDKDSCKKGCEEHHKADADKKGKPANGE